MIVDDFDECEAEHADTIARLRMALAEAGYPGGSVNDVIRPYIDSALRTSNVLTESLLADAIALQDYDRIDLLHTIDCGDCVETVRKPDGRWVLVSRPMAIASFLEADRG